MNVLDLLKRDAEYGFSELMKSLEGVTQGQAWAALPPAGDDYLNTDGTIYGITLHIASTRWMYGSICFRNSEIRWRDVADQIGAFEPSWPEALDYLKRGHEYWMASWENLQDVEKMCPTIWKEDRAAWRILQMVSHHDAYHTGQITMLRYACGESNVKPASVVEDIHTYCKDLPAW